MGGFFSKQLHKPHPNAGTVAHAEGTEAFAARIDAEKDAKVKKGTEQPVHGYVGFAGGC